MRKILGQLAGTGALIPLYTVPAGQQATVSSLVMLNTTSALVPTVRLTVAKGGANDAPAQTLHLEPLQANERVSYQEGITLAAGDVVRFNAPAGVNFHLFGSEIAG